MDDPGRTDEATPAAPRTAVATSDRDLAGSGGFERRWALHIPEVGIAAEADVRERYQRRIAAHGLCTQRDDGTWFPLNGFISVERKRQMERRRDRAGLVAC